MSDAVELDPGLTLPERYAVKGVIGRGAMGVVLHVHDRDRGLDVALKRLPELTPDAVLWLKDEFRILRDIHHENLAEFVELVEHRGNWFFTMEIIRGVDWLSWVRPNDPRRAAKASSVADDATVTGATGSSNAVDADPNRTRIDSAARGHAARTSHGDEPAGFDEGRLRDSLAQLARALAFLHDHDLVHRDLKPSNVLVEPSGRVVLLDFGVAAEVTGQRQRSETIIGTPSFMAPEQIEGEASPASDWYALGSMLYQALRGKPPYSGRNASEILDAKRLLDPVPLPDLGIREPDDLVSLAGKLLARAPADRPSAEKILFALGQDITGSTRDTHGRTRRNRSESFVGRDEELRALRDAARRARAGATIVAGIVGPAGIGKSALMDRFLADLDTSPGQMLVLTGRCHEQESVSYRAFDNMVDALGRRLREWPRERLEALAPPGLGALIRVLPAFGAIPAFVEIAATRNEATPSAADARNLAFGAFAELLRRLAREVTPVLAVDDIHWADPDSVALLRVVISEASPRMLFVVTARSSEDGLPCAAFRAVEAHLRSFSLAPLDRASSIRLVESIGRRTGAVPRERIESIVDEAKGHPLFLEELLAPDARVEGHAPKTVDEALALRFERLDDDAKRVLRAMACVFGPIPQAVCRAESDLSPERFARALSNLRHGKWLQIDGTRDADMVAPYHDRMQKAALATLSAEARRDAHAELAARLGAYDFAPDVIARHLDEAGRSNDAVKFHLAAAQAAVGSFAFERAARHYARVLENESAIDESVRLEVLESAAEAMAGAGQSRAAATAYERAAAGHRESDPQRWRLERLAAERYFSGGHVKDGIRVSKTVLARVGLRYPRNTLDANVRLVWRILLLVCSRMTFEPKADRHVTPQTAARIELSVVMGKSVVFVAPPIGLGFTMLASVLALRLGIDTYVAETLTWTSISLVTCGLLRTSARASRTVRLIAERTGSLRIGLLAQGCELGEIFWKRNDWLGSVRKATRLRQRWLAAGFGLSWEVGVIDQICVWASSYGGRVREAKEKLVEVISLAERTENHYLRVSLETHDAWVDLLDGDHERVLERAERVEREWYRGTWGYSTHDFWVSLAYTEVALYGGADEAALDALDRRWAKFWRSTFTAIPIMAWEASYCHGRYLVARCTKLARDGRTDEMRRHRRELARLVRVARRLALPAAAPVATYLEGALAHLEGDESNARRLLRETINVAQLGSTIQLAATLRLGNLLAGPEGDELLQEIRRWNESERVREPDRFWAMIAPGYAPRSA